MLVADALLAQAPTGSISGVVKDPSGAVVADASATATSIATGTKRTATTDAQGYFLLPSLLPGAYKLTVNYSGFSDYTVESLAVEVGQIAHVNVVLAIGAASTQVQVGEQSAIIDTEQATVGGVVTAKQIDELPLNGRNYLDLARLEPGVEIQAGQFFDPTKTRYTGISIAGQNGRETRITLDGIDAVDEHVGTTTLNLSQETIQEFQLSTSSSDISTGLSSSGAVNIITKSGTNQLHGTGFTYGRGSRWAARPSFGPTSPDFERYQYGAGAGGAVIKDRLFFFGNFENTHEDSAIAVSSPFFPNVTTFAAPFDEKSQNIRGDWNVNRSNTAFFRWTRNENSNFGGFGGSLLPSTGNINADNTNQWVAGWDKVFTPRLTNSARMGVTQFHNTIQRPPVNAQGLAVPGAENFRIVANDGSLTAGPDVNTPQGTSEYFNQYRDDVTYTSGRHTLRFGGDVVYRQVSVYNFAAGFPTITVNAPATRNVTDLLNSTIVSFTLGNRKGIRIPGTPDNTHRNTRFSGYVEDTWRFRPNFTIGAGLRYEVDTHPLNNDLRKPDLLSTVLAHGTDPTPINKNNLSPHLGLAWDPTKDHKTSIRAGGGLYYAGRVSNLVTNERISLAPFNSGNDTIALSAPAVFDFSHGFGAPNQFDFGPAFNVPLKSALTVIAAGQQAYISAAPLTIPTFQVTRTGTIINNNLKTPYSVQFNAGAQRELPMDTVVDVNFLYSRTIHEFMRDVDAANFFPGNGAPILLGDGSKPPTNITVINSDGFAQYKAMTVKVNKRFSKSFQYTAAYTLSRINSTSPDGLGIGSSANSGAIAGTLVNRNVQANYGVSALDRTHRLVLNGIAELPRGFRVSLISTAYSGLSNSIIVGSADLRGDGVNGALLPGTSRGSMGRDVNSIAKLNQLIRNYNQNYGGKPLPRAGQRAPYAFELPENTGLGDSFISQDIQLSKMVKIRERLELEFTAQMFNLLNISNLVGPSGLPTAAFSGVLTTLTPDATGAPTGGFKLGSDGGLTSATGGRALAGVDRPTSFGSFGAVRPSIPTGTGLPRASQFGFRFRF
jgi:Carboxypeptidase regulatory-like domain/TonB dependent receptor